MFLGAIFINLTNGYINFIVLFIIKLNYNVNKISAYKRKSYDFVKAFADKWTSSLISGTL